MRRQSPTPSSPIANRSVVAVLLLACFAFHGCTPSPMASSAMTKSATFAAGRMPESEEQSQVLLSTPSGLSGGFFERIDGELKIATAKGAEVDARSRWSGVIQLQGGQTLLCKITSDDFDPVLFLFGSKGELVGASDDADGGTDARLEFRAEASGTYRLVVVPHSADDAGRFQLELSRHEDFPAPASNGEGTKAAVASQAQNGVAMIRIIDPARGRRDSAGRGYEDWGIQVGQGISGFEFSVSSIAARLRYQIGRLGDGDRYQAITGWYDVPQGRVGGGTFVPPDPSAEGVYVVRVSAVQPGATVPYQMVMTAQRASSSTAPGGRYALLIGIDDYPSASLSTCVNDVAAIRELLMRRFGFNQRDILELTDSKATRQAVIAGFRNHLAKAGPAGVAVFFFSGHGTQVLDAKSPLPGDESDGSDEALCLWDYSPLLDDELNQLISELPTKQVLVVLDMCHAGTGTLGDDEQGDVIVKSVAPVAASGPSIAKPGRDRAVDRFGQPTDHVALVACQADQTALAPGGKAEPALSFFTGAVIDALRYSRVHRYSFEEIIGQVRIELKERYGESAEQEPAAEGAARTQAIGAFLKTPASAR